MVIENVKKNTYLRMRVLSPWEWHSTFMKITLKFISTTTNYNRVPNRTKVHQKFKLKLCYKDLENSIWEKLKKQYVCDTSVLCHLQLNSLLTVIIHHLLYQTKKLSL